MDSLSCWRMPDRSLGSAQLEVAPLGPICRHTGWSPTPGLVHAQTEPGPFHFTLLVGVSDSVDCRPSVQASRVFFRASVFC